MSGSAAGTSPTVSVVLPTWNRLPLLRKAVASVIAQTFPDWELVVVDDGSSDGTREYLQGIDDPRVRPLLLEHRGDITFVRNAGVGHSRGGWVAFLDSDDLWLPRKLELQLQQLAAHLACGWSYGAYLLVNAEEEPLPERSRRLRRPVSGHILEPLLKFEVSASVVTMLVRRSLIEEIGGFDATMSLHSDYDFALRLAARSEACALPEAVALVREHAGRTTSQRADSELHAAVERVFRKAAAAATDRRIRALCLRQCAAQMAGKAGALSREGSHRAAFAALIRGARIAPFKRVLWRTAAGCAARALGWRRVQA